MGIDAQRVTPELLEIFDLVGRAFEHEADDAFIDQIRAYVAKPITGLTPEAQKHAERGMHQLTSALAAYDKADDKPLWRDYLDASYAELFLGVTPNAVAPVESCYLNDEHVLYAEQFFQVKKEMDASGFTVPSNFKEPADHIAAEWMYITSLLQKGQIEKASTFKQSHIDLWVLDAFDYIIKSDDVGFYTGVSNLAKAALIELS